MKKTMHSSVSLCSYCCMALTKIRISKVIMKWKELHRIYRDCNDLMK
jgi:tRNA(Arg) A34 adenosine deaminase TadA